MTWRQTDMMFMGSYEVIGNSAKNIHEIEAEVLGYVKNIKAVFDLETNLLNFDKLDYVLFFQDPKLIIEQSKDLKNWSRVKLSEPLPKEYQWPHELSIELNAELKNNTFYRVKTEED